ncbi:MAG: S8 family peptidase [Elusimicrobia bacterium]|nr:S8 family peptidase [Elusimicrobiota bacterium]
MKRLLWLPVLMGLAVCAPRAFAALTERGVENRIIVAFKLGTPAAEQRQIVAAHGLQVVDEIPSLAVLLVQAPSHLAVPARVRLASHPKVFRADADVWRKWIETAPASMHQTPFAVESAVKDLAKLASSAKAASAQAGKSAEEIPWGVKRVNAPAAWSSNQGSGVKVAVIDTGIDPDQPDLKVAGGHNSLDKNASWADDHFHGTHVAGTIAAAMNDKAVVGVAPKAELYAVKVLTKEGSGDLFGIMDGIMWTAQNGIQVANMSLGAPQEMPLLQYALKMAVGAGVTFVAAAGNDGKAVNWPGAYPETIAVSALCPAGVTNTKLCPNANEGISTFSSRGPEVAFIAPGVLVPSTVPLSHDASGVKAYSGTSMACPHVAGLAALAVAKGAKGPDAVRAALAAAATKLNGLSAEEQGNGLVDAAKLR